MTAGLRQNVPDLLPKVNVKFRLDSTFPDLRLVTDIPAAVALATSEKRKTQALKAGPA